MVLFLRKGRISGTSTSTTSSSHSRFVKEIPKELIKARKEMTPQQLLQFQTFADEQVAEHLEMYEELVYDDLGRLDFTQWQQIKQQDQLCVFKQRPLANRTSLGNQSTGKRLQPQQQKHVTPKSTKSQISTGSSSTEEASSHGHGDSLNTRPTIGEVVDDPNAKYIRNVTGEYRMLDKRRASPTLLTLGTIPGSLQEVVYGAFADSAKQIRLRSSYIGDNIEDVVILHEFVTPTVENPYRFMGLAWCRIKTCPLTRSRDLLVVINMGVALTRRQERVFFSLITSVDVPELFPTDFSEYKTVRAKMNWCSFLRQTSDPDTVHVYQRAIADPCGKVLCNRMSTCCMTKNMLTMNKVVDCAQKKKLAWKRTQAQIMNGRQRFLGFNKNQKCHACKRTLAVKDIRPCEICQKNFCARCTMDETLTTHVTSKGYMQCRMPFCVRCVLEAQYTNTEVVAMEELMQNMNVDDNASDGLFMEHFPYPWVKQSCPRFWED